MSSGISLLFTLFFPALSFMGGAYLLFRGFARKAAAGTGSGITGIISCIAPIRSHISNEPCVYSRTLVERYAPAASAWRPICVLEAKAPFVLGGRHISPECAVFEVSRHRVFQGYGAERKSILKGMATKILPLLPQQLSSRLVSVLSLGSSIPEHTQVAGEGDALSPEVMEALLAHSAAAEVRKHLKEPLRIIERSLAIGSTAYALGDPVGNGEVTISDSGEDHARSSLSERSLAGIGVGVALMCLSFVLLFFMFA